LWDSREQRQEAKVDAGVAMNGRRFLITVWVAAGLLLALPPRAWTETKTPGEYEVKAAYLYQFTKFIEWPADTAGTAASTLSVCILGKSPFGGAISNIAGMKVRSRNVVVTGISRGEEIDDCDIIFVSASEKSRLSQILASSASHPVLTISDIKHFVAAGGMIGFVSVGDKVRFEINQKAMQRSNLRVSAKLLKLATTVVE
jgi:hypothetical protein